MGYPKAISSSLKLAFKSIGFFCSCFVFFFFVTPRVAELDFPQKNKPSSFLGNFLHKSLVAIYILYISYLNNAEHLDLISFVLVYVFKKPLIYVKLSLV